METKEREIRTELYRDNFQNYKKYGIPKAQLVIADIPYNLGKNAYIQIYPLEELDEVNRDYEIQEYLPGYFVWGTDLGGMLFGYSQKTGMYSAVDSVSLNEDDLMYEEPSLLAFLKRWDAELE